jgi:hypothetical protein
MRGGGGGDLKSFQIESVDSKMLHSWKNHNYFRLAKLAMEPHYSRLKERTSFIGLKLSVTSASAVNCLVFYRCSFPPISQLLQ